MSHSKRKRGLESVRSNKRIPRRPIILDTACDAARDVPHLVLLPLKLIAVVIAPLQLLYAYLHRRGTMCSFMSARPVAWMLQSLEQHSGRGAS